jgi:hypothetical protein
MAGIKDVLTKAKRSKVVKEAKRGHDFGKKNTGKNTGFQSVVDKAMKEYNSKKTAERVAGAAFWKQRAK